MDIQMPDLNGLECTKRLKQALPRLKVVIITGRDDETLVQLSLQAGANAYLIKPVHTIQFLATLRFAAVSGVETRLNAGKQEADFFSPGPSGDGSLLSPQEREVLSGLADGLLYKEIADKMGISFSTVHKYQHNIFRKLHAMNRTEAILKWNGSQAESLQDAAKLR